ncbi:MAG: HEAT repeat domain-containing protein [Balneolaceae bacterium]|nr:HEAT repeat domain-containing protein [Balneolaceae bacterium]
MNPNTLTEKQLHLLTGYILESLTESEKVEFRRMAENGVFDPDELGEMRRLYSEMDSEKIPEPGASLDRRFQELLNREKNRQWKTGKRSWKAYLGSLLTTRKLAYAVSIFLVGIFVGDIYTPVSNRDRQIDRLSMEMNHLREMLVISLLDNSSSIERLKAVNIGNDIRSVDAKVTEALLQTLNNDSNVNVRLAAVDALVKHASNPEVRSGLINAISRQESAVVQTALADAMLILQESRSVDELKKLLEQNELEGSVRDKLENTIAALHAKETRHAN